ncbi:MAG: gluconate permease [Planctomycetes bacterium]|nr:gluconate permease [Planctomycetota bacterium]
MTGQLTAAPGADAPGGSGSRTADGSRPARESRPAVAWPLVTLLVGIAAVLGLIIGLKANAFMALVTAAMVVSLMAGGPASERISRVAAAFGESAGKIGVVIALAAVIGKCMLDSGAADRIVRGFLRLFGQRRAPLALMGSGFVLGIPVFFDTVFYLLIPLARSLYRKTGRNFLLYVLAIGAGGAITHTLVPPTPGPLVMASNLDFPVGILIMVGLVVAAPAAVAGLLFAGLANRRMPIPMRPVGSEPEPDPLEDSQLPSLGLSLAPVVLPVVLISANTVFAMWAKGPGSAAWVKSIADVAAIVGDANLALLVATVIALGTLALKRGLNRGQLAHVAEVALTSGGVIILITAAGGAFGAMLKVAEVGPAIQYVFSGVGATGLMIIVLGFSIGAVLKIAQGSSTVAMITGTAMLAGIASSGSLGFHPVYLATAIGAGSLVGSWMNDSGFWIVAKMSGLTEGEALKSWTAMLVVLAFTGLLATMALASVMPYPPFTVAPLAD